MKHEYAVLLPEKVIITYPLAGLGSRVLAQILDLLIVWFSIFALTLGMGSTLGNAAALFIPYLWVFGPLAYFTLFEWLGNGQTIGKRSMNLRVRMDDGTPITFRGAFYRNLLRPADFLPALYFGGFIAMFSNEKSQRIGDLAAGTVVVLEKREMPRFSPAPHRAGLHPLEEHVGPLPKMTLEEYFAIKRLCDRFPELPQNIQQRMLDEVWRPFAQIHGIRPLPNVHPIYLMEAVVMGYSRSHGFL